MIISIIEIGTFIAAMVTLAVICTFLSSRLNTNAAQVFQIAEDYEYKAIPATRDQFGFISLPTHILSNGLQNISNIPEETILNKMTTNIVLLNVAFIQL